MNISFLWMYPGSNLQQSHVNFFCNMNNGLTRNKSDFKYLGHIKWAIDFYLRNLEEKLEKRFLHYCMWWLVTFVILLHCIFRHYIDLQYFMRESKKKKIISCSYFTLAWLLIISSHSWQMVLMILMSLLKEVWPCSVHVFLL